MRSWPRLAVTIASSVALAAAGCAGIDIESPPASGGAASSPSPPATSPPPSPEPSPTPTPPPRLLLRIGAIGDYGTGAADQALVAARMCRVHRRLGLDLVVTTGDNIYPDGDPARFDDAFFEPYRCLLDAGVPWHASLGNHDVLTDGGRPVVDEPAFGMKGRRYVIVRGRVQIVFEDSNSLDLDWLREATRARPGVAWTIVVFHHPVLSPGTGHGSTPGLRPVLPRLFARRGVDVVLNGHDHIYSISKPRRGIRYVVTGGGGAPLYGCSEQAYVDRCVARHHFVVVELHTDRVSGRAFAPRGRAFDRWTTRGI